jgi:hypothetical protein
MTHEQAAKLAELNKKMENILSWIKQYEKPVGIQSQEWENAWAEFVKLHNEQTKIVKTLPGVQFQS